MIATIGVTPVALVACALLFGVLSGANDGGTLVSFATRTAVLPPGLGVLVLAVLVTTGPMFVGTSVASTLARRLVAFDGGNGHVAFLAAVASALAVVVILTRRGLSTSLTLALTGGIAGAGLGDGLRVSWTTLGSVLGIGLVAPVVSVGAAFAVTKGLSAMPATWWVARGGRVLQRVGFAAQSLAYSGNDAQKMVAMFAVASQALVVRVTPHWDTQLALGACFALGAVIGIRPLATRVAERVLPVRPANAVALELSSSAVVFVSSALGAPISSTQAATAALVGTGLAGGSHQVRWQEVRGVALAWVFTLPSAIALGTLLGLVARALR